MSKIEEKLQNLYNNIVNATSSFIFIRKDIINKALLSLEITQEDIGNPLTTNYGSTWNLPRICEKLGNQRSILKGQDGGFGETENDILKFNFQDALDYDISTLALTLPTTDVFGYTLVDNSGNPLTLSETPGDSNYYGNFYFVQTDSSNDLSSIDTELTPFTSPNVISDVQEYVEKNFNKETNIINFTLTHQPIYKNTGPTLEIYSDAVKVGEADQYGIVTNVSNVVGIEFEVNEEQTDYSSMAYSNRNLKLVIKTSPSGTPTLKVKYDYEVSKIEIVDTHTNFDTTRLTFEAILSEEPNLDSVQVKLNDEVIAILGNNSKFFSLKIDLLESCYNQDNREAKVKIKEISEEGANIVKFCYTKKDEANITEDIEILNKLSKTINFTIDNTPVLYKDVDILFEDTIKATSDDSGVISGAYTTESGTGTISGSIDVNGALSLTFTGDGGTEYYPSADTELIVNYSFASGLTEWETDYNIIDIDSIGVVGDLKTITLDTAVNSPPELLKTYPIKSKYSHEIWGKMICICTGLQLNTNWLPIYIKHDGIIAGGTPTVLTSTEIGNSNFEDNVLTDQTIYLNNDLGTGYTIVSNTGSTITVSSSMSTGTDLTFEIYFSPEDLTLLNHEDFKDLFGWLDPDNDSVDDIIKSANSNYSSNGVETSPGIYGNIRQNPFWPATLGEHETQQPGSLGINDIFAGNYIYEESGSPVWSIHNDLRFSYDLKPALGDTVNPSNSFYTDLNNIDTFTSANTKTIPNDGSPVGYTYRMQANYIEVDISGGGWNPYTCYYNDLQTALDANLTDIKTQLGLLDDSFVDPNYSGIDATWWTNFDNYETELLDFETYHSAYQSTWSGGNPGGSVYSSTDIDTLIALGFATIVNSRITTINTRVGTTVSSGSYVEDIYTVCNAMDGRDIGYIVDLIRDFLNILNSYTDITNIRKKYRFLKTL